MFLLKFEIILMPVRFICVYYYIDELKISSYNFD